MNLTPLQTSCATSVERVPNCPGSLDKSEALGQLAHAHQAAAKKLGFSAVHYCPQVHGREVARITETASADHWTGGVDGLYTNTPGVCLGIHSADCGVLFLRDVTTGAIGLLHSGKKGTELNITRHLIEMMTQDLGTDPTNLVAVLGPAIRPPHYEVDFPATIREQALAAGIQPANYHDEGLCTSDLSRYYSYRLEKGNTGRLLALLGIPA